MSRMSRLPGRSVRHFGWALQRHQLWLTEQYVMSRELSMFQEDVRRFYYRDIQAIITAPTTNFKICNGLAGSLLIFLGVWGVLALIVNSAAAMALAIAAAIIPAAILLGNLALGPTCRTTIYTAAAEVQLHSLGRQRSTERAIALLVPFVEAAQRDMAVPAPAPDAARERPAPPPLEQPESGDEALTPPPGPDPSDR